MAYSIVVAVAGADDDDSVYSIVGADDDDSVYSIAGAMMTLSVCTHMLKII